ncbi:MAG: redox-regulated ATPase YchF [Bacteroidales bacterium]|nr:redox-regulated ATPase YchF [Bacteroidales bacterium]
MALKVGIVGLTNIGKTTIFNCFSNTKAETSNYSFSTNKSNVGMTKVPDDRLYELEKYQPTEKIIHTTMEFVDIPGLTKGSSQGQGIGNSFLGDIRNMDAIIHVIRCFQDENLPHVEGSINPYRDIEILNLELQIKDLESIEKRIEKALKNAKGGSKDAKKEAELLTVYKDHLENFQNARTVELKEEEKAFLGDLFLLTDKPVMYVCNVDDESAAGGNQYTEEVKRFVAENDPEATVLILAAKLEAEIAELEEDDQKEFLSDAGLNEPGINKLIRTAYDLLNLSIFFTIGPKEIRAWTIKKGATAPEAAGAIHSDLKRGFIRAEVIHYNDFMELKSEAACKENGKFHIEGKEYIVQEGDLLHIRFNV